MKHYFFTTLPARQWFLAIAFVVTTASGALLLSHNVFADGFNAGHIIDDGVFTNTNTMNAATIQIFLNSKVSSCDTNGTQVASDFGSSMTHAQYAASRGWSAPPYTCLKNYTENGLTAAQIIYNVSQQYQINPQVLIVLLQKEQGLVTDSWPLATQYKTATGYGCPDTAACDSTYYGFTNQITWAAKMYRAIMNASPTWSTPYILGNNYIQYNPDSSCGGSTVDITDRATQALYNYTPYQPNAAALAAPMGTSVNCGAYGNLNFYRYFTSWFGTVTMPTSSVYIPNGIYSLQSNLSSSQYLDVAGANSANGAKIWIYHGDGTNAQNWSITRDSDGYYSLQNVATGKYLDVTNGSIAAGTEVQSWDGNGSCAQKWAAVYQGNGSYTFLGKCSDMALDVSSGNASDGTNVQIWYSNLTASQGWSLISKNNAPVNDGFYQLTDSAGLALDINGSQTTDGARVQLSNAGSATSQIWQFVRQADGMYTVRNPVSGKYLDVTNAGTTDGTPMQIWSGDGSCAQKWIVINNGNNFTLQSACSSLVLDITGGAVSTTGTAVQAYTSNGTPAQQWSMNRLSGSIPIGMYSLRTSAGLALDVTGGSTVAGARTQLWSTNHTGAQMWQITQLGDGSYSLLNVGSGKYLDVAGGSTAGGAPVQIWDGNSTCAQRWRVTDNNDSTFTLLSSCSNLALDVRGGAIASTGTSVQIYAQNGTVAQSWRPANP